ncbi:MAG: hypothetical protein HETSPECPRED_009649 [Heterodermia speciosa]|uniref:Uncharacterized protein n=1 Tax=Heterodermia speciosa TaxID=116794 RepID=A0A8H3ERQ6_9LECA|nr:MAG: hypothetical protein HETSPECPRED_009649 [Heterodermia speciosa]
MDPQRIQHLLSRETTYVADTRFSWELQYMIIDDGLPVLRSTIASDSLDNSVFCPKTQRSPLILLYIRQKRVYYRHGTANWLSIDSKTWLDILTKFDVLPSFLELLHSNNGGTMAYKSYNSYHRLDTPAQSDGISADKLTKAFHVAYKMGNWGNQEYAIYARQCFTSSRSFVLVMGSPQSIDLQRVYRMLQRRVSANILSITLALQSAALAYLEEIRWSADYKVQDLEVRTGIGSFRNAYEEALPITHLAFDKDLQTTKEWIQNALMWGSYRARLNLEALLTHIKQYEQFCSTNGDNGLSEAALDNLQSACQMQVELAINQHLQMALLLARANAQLDVTAALIAQRDTQININIAQTAQRNSLLNVEIAREAKRESELMRGIAAVTMIFLPATFVATFFSMVFFHVGEEDSVRFVVDRRIWLYPTVALPCTLFISTWYLGWAYGWTLDGAKRMQAREGR